MMWDNIIGRIRRFPYSYLKSVHVEAFISLIAHILVIRLYVLSAFTLLAAICFRFLDISIHKHTHCIDPAGLRPSNSLTLKFC